MFQSLKNFLKVYPLPIFVLLLTFVVYYFAFELLHKKEDGSILAQTEVDSMLNKGNQTIEVATNTMPPAESPQPIAPEIPQEPQVQVEQPAKTYITSNTRSLNIRQEPNTTSAIVGKLTPADQMFILEEKGEWIAIADAISEKPVGWIMKRFSKEIEIPTEPVEIATPKQPADPNKTHITASVRSLNIRQEPNTTSAVIGKLTPSHKAVILEERGEWILIGTFEDNKVLGWILKRLSQEIPQEVTIAEPKNLVPTNATPQALPNLPTNVESTQNVAQPAETKTQDAIQSTQDAPIYTSRVPSLNIRQLPSTDTPVVGKLTPNDAVIIVETQDVWVRILDANTPSVKNGWVVRRSLIERQ